MVGKEGRGGAGGGGGEGEGGGGRRENGGGGREVRRWLSEYLTAFSALGSWEGLHSVC